MLIFKHLTKKCYFDISCLSTLAEDRFKENWLSWHAWVRDMNEYMTGDACYWYKYSRKAQCTLIRTQRRTTGQDNRASSPTRTRIKIYRDVRESSMRAVISHPRNVQIALSIYLNAAVSRRITDGNKKKRHGLISRQIFLSDIIKYSEFYFNLG